MANRLPKPIPKPRIEVSTETTGAKKDWQTKPAMQVVPGDIIQGRNRGWVTEVRIVDGGLRLFFKNGLHEDMPHDFLVIAFSEVH